MVKVILKPIDNDHKPVELSEGKTILGRGPLLGCSDKKVSRNHAVLEINSDGEIFLTPTHVNPCFYRTKSDANPKMMKKDKALRLEPGDVFSLLPLTFQYQILLSSEDTPTQSSTGAESSKEDASKDKGTSEDLQKGKDDGDVEDRATPAKEAVKSGSNENGKPDQEDDEIEVPDDDEEDIDALKPKRRATTGTRGRKRGSSAAASTVSSRDEPRRKRSLPNWLIKSANSQQEKNNNGDALQKGTDDRSKRRGRKSQSEGGSMSRSARQNRQTIQRISLEDFVVSEDDWNSEDSGDRGGVRAGSGRGGGPAKRGRRRAAADNSSGSDWETEHKSQGRGGRDAARDASSGSDWEANTRRSGRRGMRRRAAAAAAGDSESGSDWETDRRKKTPVQKKTRGRRSRRKMEDDDEEDEEDETEERSVASDTVRARDRTSPKKEEEEDDEGEEDEEEEEEEEEEEPDDNETKKNKDSTSNTTSKKEAKLSGVRKVCQFGRKCYRKNAAHLDNFSHPGDSDYESPGEDGADGKTSKKSKDDKENEGSDQTPECPYGTDCYRKNPQHRKDFQHTKKARPKREASSATAKKAKRSKDDGDEGDIPHDITDDEESDEYKPDDSEEKKTA